MYHFYFPAVTGHTASRDHAEFPAHRRGPLPPDARPHQTKDAVVCVRPWHLAPRSLHCVALPHLHHLPGPRGEYLHVFTAHATGIRH